MSKKIKSIVDITHTKEGQHELQSRKAAAMSPISEVTVPIAVNSSLLSSTTSVKTLSSSSTSASRKNSTKPTKPTSSTNLKILVKYESPLFARFASTSSMSAPVSTAIDDLKTRDPCFRYKDPNKFDLTHFVPLIQEFVRAHNLSCWNCSDTADCTNTLKSGRNKVTDSFNSTQTTARPVRPALPVRPPVFICDYINDDLQTYSTSGYFCSLGCCCWFLRERTHYNTPTLLSNTLVFYRKFLQEMFLQLGYHDDEIKTSIKTLLEDDKSKPSPYLSLAKYGVGTMSIEDYRNYGKTAMTKTNIAEKTDNKINITSYTSDLISNKDVKKS